ncbi:spore coat protein [Candidatus Woesearchaeota archaeon]|jgi:glucose-1-phosphate thymidylyltransferase|nr:spore coat protein [Candidatus Woesearchaeota archaeon]|tara:strand:+ start:118 stop:840 length:723 start_codon:yes stop_codon:yes gene_type:complete
MKGVVLAGGTGSRLYPITKVTNKHLLPVYDEPMIYYPIKTLLAANITDILIIVGGESIGDFLKLLGSGKELGANITYRAQIGSAGIPVALALAKEFIGNSKFMVVLGDNIMEDSLKKEAEIFEKNDAGSHIFVKEVKDPERYGVVEVKENKVIKITEKPKQPKSNLIASGVYMFSPKVFDIIPNLKPSARGEIEISDVLNMFIKNNNLSFSGIEGYWTDAGTLESLYHANTIVRNKKTKK